MRIRAPTACRGHAGARAPVAMQEAVMAESTQMGARLRAVRRLHGLTQQELADLAKVSKSLISKVEQGTRPGSWELAIAVARAVRVDAAALLGEVHGEATTP